MTAPDSPADEILADLMLRPNPTLVAKQKRLLAILANPVPEGTYLVRVAHVQASRTDYGDEQWFVQLVIDDGSELHGRFLVDDCLVFSTRGKVRARAVLQALRLPKAGSVTVEPDDLVDRRALVTVRRDTPRLEVAFDGWAPAPQEPRA